MKRFLLIEHGGLRKNFTLETLKNKNLDVYIACTTNPEWLTNFVDKDKVIITDTYNVVKLLADVVNYMIVNDVKFDAMGTFFEGNVTQTADLAKALGLIGADTGAVRRSSSNKGLMRLWARSHDIPTPKFTMVKDLTELNLKSAIKEVGVPCVVKPVFGSNSFGTVKIDTEKQIQDVIKEVKLNTTSSTSEAFKNFESIFLVEEYMQGPVVSIDGIVQDKKPQIVGMVEFAMGPEPRFTQEADYIPPRFDKKTIEDAYKMTERIVKTLEFNNCGFHCEMRLTPEGPKLIEIASRLPGGPLQPGYKKAYGVDLTEALIDIWLGKKVKLSRKSEKWILQKAVFPTKSGTLKKLSGIDSEEVKTKVWEVASITKVGDEVVTYPNAPTPIYYYSVVADSAAERDKLAEEIEGLVEYEIS